MLGYMYMGWHSCQKEEEEEEALQTADQSAFVSMKPLDLYNVTSGWFQASFVVIEPVILSPNIIFS